MRALIVRVFQSYNVKECDKRSQYSNNKNKPDKKILNDNDKIENIIYMYYNHYNVVYNTRLFLKITNNITRKMIKV